MLLDALVRIKMTDDTLSLRRSCREGICGSDAMNINGKNGLACITKIVDLKEPGGDPPAAGAADHPRPDRRHDAFLRAIPLDQAVPDQRRAAAEKERLQSPHARAELDGLYECILCACCSTSCPSFWWNPDKFVGPAGLLNAYRFIADSRDQAANERLDDLKDPYRLFRCHSIMNCVDVCPKGLNPTSAIGKIKDAMVRRAV
jgi:succinate dehydrogenase / fumarate reductase iron-sulfur subunit